MVIMDNGYDSLQDLRQSIEQNHLTYLNMEDTPDKMKIRNHLEEYIKRYLCAPSRSQKFYLPETLEVLHRSATRKTDFSAYKAANGWNAIQLYAGNLLAQPWRKEYRRIKTYSGFYKHQIEANLVGAEVMFDAMGYKHAGDGILILDGPICPDLVQSVSLDCLLAYVECQIMKSIWEDESTAFPKTWLDIFDFRKQMLCPSEKNRVLKQVEEIQHPRQSQNTMDLYSNYFPQNSGHQHMCCSHGSVIQPSSSYYTFNRCCPNNFQPPYVAAAAAAPLQGYSYLPFSQPQPSVINGYYFPQTNGYIAPQVQQYSYNSVPTAQLIEYESQNGGFDVVDRPNRSRPHVEKMVANDLHKSKNGNETKNYNKVIERESLSPREETSQLEDWNYVYRNLESQGYTKDLGERGDILSPSEGNSEHHYSMPPKENLSKKIRTTDLDTAIRGLVVSEARNSTTIKQPERRLSQDSSYENVTPPKDQPAKQPKSKISSIQSNSKTKSLPREKPAVTTTINNTTTSSKTLDTRKSKIVKNGTSANSWSCQYCTFLNENKPDVCEMCGKSRYNTTDKPIEVGGAECSKCTLVNPKSEKTCLACGEDLKNSPTYI